MKTTVRDSQKPRRLTPGRLIRNVFLPWLEVALLLAFTALWAWGLVMTALGAVPR